MNQDWIKWPLECHATAVRQGEEEPCGKPAIAVAIYDGEEFEPHAFSVCGHHARGRKVMPLPVIIQTIKARIYAGAVSAIGIELHGADGGYADGLNTALRIIEKETSK